MTNDKTIELLNTTDLEFEPLNDEWREYDYVVDGKVITLRVEQPRYVNIHPVHGAHRILDADGVSHYMPGNWLTRVGLRWKVNEGAPHFSFTVAQLPQTEEPEVSGPVFNDDWFEELFGYLNEGLDEEPADTEDAGEVFEFALPETIGDLFERLGRFEPFTTVELEEAAAFFSNLEGSE